jgi:hypothetical protein
MTALVAALGWLTGSTAGRYLGIALLALAGLLVA